MSRILVTYYTKTGSTKEVAERIGSQLQGEHLEVDVMPMSAVSSLDGYSGVVIGAPINGMNWVPEAGQFVSTHQAALSQVPTAYFFLSYLIVEGRNNWKNTIKKSLNKVSEQVQPVQVGMFGGKVESAFPTVFRWLFGVRKDAPLDVRDWDAINNWAKSLSGKLN